MGHVVASPALIEKYAELLAALTLADPQLDSLKGELLHLAASGVRLERNVVENHLVRQGMGVLARLDVSHGFFLGLSKKQKSTEAGFLQRSRPRLDARKTDGFEADG